MNHANAHVQCKLQLLPFHNSQMLLGTPTVIENKTESTSPIGVADSVVCYLEIEDKSPAYAPPLRIGVIKVIEATHVFNVKHLEDVVESHVGFDVRTLAVHRCGDGRKYAVDIEGSGEVVEVITPCIFRQQRIVF